MPDLLHAQERDRLLASLRRALRPVILEGQRLTGLARQVGHGGLLHTRDNAVAAELMAIPALRAADPPMAEALFAFTAAMVEDSGPPSRGAEPPGAPRLEILNGDPRNLRVVTPWHDYSGDLGRGVLRQRLRGEGTRGDVLHTGNMARLRLQGGVPGLLGRFSLRPRTLDVEEAITAQGVGAEGMAVVMWHESTLRLSPMPGITVDAGTLRYEYRVSAADPVLRLTVTLRAGPKAGLAAVRLTTALDDLSQNASIPVHASVGQAGAQSRRPAGPFAEEEAIATGAMDSLHLWQDGPEEDALAIHISPRAGNAVISAKLTSRAGVPHWLVLRHGVPNLPRGGTATLWEDRLLVRGVAPGAPEAALRLLRSPGNLLGRDPGQSGQGAPLAALAAVLLNASAFNPPLPREQMARLRDALDRQLAALPELESSTLPVGELAALALGLDGVVRAGGLPREARRLRQVLGHIMAAASPAGAIGKTLEEHGAALLAIARAAALLAEPSLLEALRQGVAALSPRGPALAGMEAEAAPTTRTLSAVLRAMRAVEAGAAAGHLHLDAATLDRAAAVAEACLQRLSARLRPMEDRLEILATDGGQPDPTSTAALLLALLSPDEAAFAAGRVAA